MAKKRTTTPLSLSSFNADLDSVLNSLDGGDTIPTGTEGAGDEQSSVTPVTEAKAETSLPPERSAQRVARRSKPERATVPGKKKPTSAFAADGEPSGTLPPSSFTKEELGWFFAQAVDTSQLKRIYVPESTKEVLQLVALSSKIPISHLTDNILRWFLVANRDEIRKIVSHHRKSLDRLDG